MPLDEIRIGLSKATSGRLVSIFGTALTERGLETTGLPEAFDWLNLALEIAKPSQTASVIPKGPEPAPPNPRDQSILSEKLESWLARIETDLDPEEFHTKFRSFTLPSWDHYSASATCLLLPARIQKPYLLLLHQNRTYPPQTTLPGSFLSTHMLWTVTSGPTITPKTS